MQLQQREGADGNLAMRYAINVLTWKRIDCTIATGEAITASAF
jgi:hypothetical protein